MRHAAQPRVRVWDAFQRLLHFGLVVSVVLCGWVGEEGLQLHIGAGYVALGLVLARVLWGFVGSRHARWSGFLRSPRVTLDYARGLMRGQARRYVGHNPLGGWMSVALLASVAVACTSGWLYTTDRFWGLAWVEWLHRASAWAVLVLGVLHVLAALAMSWWHREALIGAMLDGRKRADEGQRP